MKPELNAFESRLELSCILKGFLVQWFLSVTGLIQTQHTSHHQKQNLCFLNVEKTKKKNGASTHPHGVTEANLPQGQKD